MATLRNLLLGSALGQFCPMCTFTVCFSKVNFHIMTKSLRLNPILPVKSLDLPVLKHPVQFASSLSSQHSTLYDCAIANVVKYTKNIWINKHNKYLSPNSLGSTDTLSINSEYIYKRGVLFQIVHIFAVNLVFKGEQCKGNGYSHSIKSEDAFAAQWLLHTPPSWILNPLSPF